jgi:hypothetical protein
MPSLSSIRDFWRSLESRSQITLVLSLLAVVATMYGIYHFASQPSYTTVEAGLSTSSTSSVTSALSSRRGQVLGFGPREGWSGWDSVEALLPRAERPSATRR